MARVVMLKNPRTGILKKGYYGFSWTFLFFGGIVPVIRGDVVRGLAILAFQILLLIICFGSIFGAPFYLLVILIWAFVYNRHYTTKLLEEGYEIADAGRSAARARTKLGVAPTGEGPRFDEPRLAATQPGASQTGAPSAAPRLGPALSRATRQAADASSPDYPAMLVKLKDALDKGALTQAEYDSLKSGIIAKIQG